VECDFEILKVAFDEQAAVFVDIVDEASDLSDPTALVGWDCAVLVGHVSTAIEALWRWRGDAPESAVEVDAVGWWDLAVGVTNDAFAQRYARKRSHVELRELIHASVARARELVPATAPDLILVAPGAIAWTRFDQALATRVFELTVHGLDLAMAIGSNTEMSSAALDVAGRLLDGRLDGSRPGDITDEAKWVLAATGRIDHLDVRLPVMR
jgi:hypothetical protein